MDFFFIRFALLVNLGKKITDFGSDAVNALTANINEEQIDETYGINVQFEESEEESDNDMYGEIRDEDGQEEGEEAKIDHTLHAENVNETFWNFWFMLSIHNIIFLF